MAIQSWAGCVVPEDLLYDLDYDVWVKVDGETVSLGMTDVAQSRCGRLVQVSWKAPGKKSNTRQGAFCDRECQVGGSVRLTGKWGDP
jgi:glycine cleavage system H lipoate-binding protein